MRRGWKILIAAVIVLAALLAINVAVIGGQTKPAGITAEGGEILELSSVDLQVVDLPASDPGPGPEGAPIVLLHCYSCSLHWWDEFVPLVNEEHRVIRLDLIGFGGSQKPGSGYSMSDQARAVAEALNELGVEAAVVVGHSMGGAVAAALAQNSSELVDRVAMIGTASSLSDDASLPFTARLSYLPVLGEALWRLMPDSAIRGAYESAFAPGFDYEAAFANPDQVIDDFDSMTFTSYEQSHDESEAFTDEATIAARITDAAVPLLAILGAEDQIVDVEPTEEAYAAVPGAEVEVLGGVGHSAHIEAPGKTAALLEEFAKGAPAPIVPVSGEKPKQKAEREKLQPIPGIREQLGDAKEKREGGGNGTHGANGGKAQGAGG